MTQPNQSELVETVLSILGIVDRTSGNRPEQIATLKQELTAHTNAEIARTLDRLQHELDGGRTYTSVSMIEDAIQSERAKLKEVK